MESAFTDSEAIGTAGDGVEISAWGVFEIVGRNICSSSVCACACDDHDKSFGSHQNKVGNEERPVIQNTCLHLPKLLRPK